MTVQKQHSGRCEMVNDGEETIQWRIREMVNDCTETTVEDVSW